MGKTTTITQTQEIPASPAEVYGAFADAKKHAAFTGSKATFEAKAGGKFTAWDGYIYGKNLELKPGKRLVQEWMTTEWPEGQAPSIVEFSFKAAKGGTRVKMVHSKVPAEQADDYRQGWTDYYWKPLKQYFAKLAKRA